MTEEPELYERVVDMYAPDRRKAEERMKEEIRKMTSDMQWVLSDPRGRRFIFWAIEQGEFFADSYNGRSLDMARQSGEKAICSRILGLALSADPYIFAKFIEDKLVKKEK